MGGYFALKSKCKPGLSNLFLLLSQLLHWEPNGETSLLSLLLQPFKRVLKLIGLSSGDTEAARVLPAPEEPFRKEGDFEK